MADLDALETFTRAVRTGSFAAAARVLGITPAMVGRRIQGLEQRYGARLIERTGSPIVRLNHAVAVGMAEGPAAGLALVDALMMEGELASYHYAPSVRGDLLEKLGRAAEARLSRYRFAHS